MTIRKNISPRLILPDERLPTGEPATVAPTDLGTAVAMAEMPPDATPSVEPAESGSPPAETELPLAGAAEPEPANGSSSPDGPGWALRSSGYYRGFETSVSETRAMLTIHLAKHNPPGSDRSITGFAGRQYKETIDQMTTAIRQQMETGEKPAYRDWLAVRQQLADHDLAVRRLRAELDEMQARRRRLELSSEPDLAKKLQEVDVALAPFRNKIADEEAAISTLTPVLDGHRRAAESLIASLMNAALTETRSAQMQRRAEVVAKLVACEEVLDGLVLADLALRYSGNASPSMLTSAIMGR